jgi:hypothetical protein
MVLFSLEMVRFQRNNTLHFLNQPNATVNSPINSVRYIKAWLTQQISNAMGIGHVPTVKQVLDYILARCEQIWQAQIAHQVNLGTANQILEAVVASMIPNNHALECTADNELAPITNRMGFNALVDLVAFDKANPATFAPLSPPAQAFRARLPGSAAILRYIVCGYQEGSPATPNDPNYVCDNTRPGSTVGMGAFARSLRQCACKPQGTCLNPLCEWINNADGQGNGACVSNVRQFGQGPAPTFGRRTRFLDGTEFTDMRRGGAIVAPPAAYQQQQHILYNGAAPFRYFTRT